MYKYLLLCPFPKREDPDLYEARHPETSLNVDLYVQLPSPGTSDPALVVDYYIPPLLFWNWVEHEYNSRELSRVHSWAEDDPDSTEVSTGYGWIVTVRWLLIVSHPSVRL